MNKETALKIYDKIAKMTDAHDFALYIGSSEKTHTRFAQNGITQHISGIKEQISLTVCYENKSGTYQINNTSDEAIELLVKNSEILAKRNQPDPEFMPTLGKVDLPDVNNFSEETENLPLEKIINDIAMITQKANAIDAKLSGMSTKTKDQIIFITKNGFFGDVKSNGFGHSMTIKKGAIETKVSKGVKNYADFSMEQEMEQLLNQFYSLDTPQKLEPTKLNVILRPNAVKDWFTYLMWILDQRNADDGLTPFSEKLNTKIFGEKFSCFSTLKDPQIHASPWMLDGVPSRDIEWVKNGVLKNMFADRFYAQKQGIKPQKAYNLFVEGGNTSEQEMMQMVDRGVIINSLWYIRNIDQKRGEMTGLTRDGVMYFEDGKIKRSVYNFRWNEIMHEVTQRLIALGNSIPVEPWVKVPSMLIKDFNFVDVTTF